MDKPFSLPLEIMSAVFEQSNNQLIGVEEALKTILETLSPVESELIPLANAFGRVLAEPVLSDVNVPPFTNSAMDGYAVVAASSRGAAAASPVRLTVIENIPAGQASDIEITSDTCARIMTGAPIPRGADAVVRFEETSEHRPAAGLADNEVLLYRAVSSGDNVRLAGEDIRANQTVLESGHRLRPQDVGVLAAIGRASIPVYRRPRVAILATGDELVALDQPVGPGQIRNSNEFVQGAMVEKYGGQAIMLGIAHDTVTDLTQKINAGLAQNVDLFLTSAGVSVGDYDVVKTVLAELGQMQFWQVGIKPGKPLAFGVLQPEDGDRAHRVPLIGLPGNPVAAMVAFEVFARPAILKLAGHAVWNKATMTATLDEDVTNSGRRHYMRAYMYPTAKGYRVTTRDSGVRVQGSGILTSMVWANCLVVVPEKVTELPAGSSVTVWILD
jgi:molybdopterin molybdotransferase